MKFVFILMILLCSLSCNSSIAPENVNNNHNSISFMTWNTQTFFDGETEGSEYTEFQKNKNWNEGKYKSRLTRLCQVIEATNPDIFILQEIENQSVIQDISNLMAGNSWNKKNTWPYVCFSKNEGHALGCCLFSKFPVSNIKTHNIEIKTEEKQQPALRPIMEISIDIKGKPLIIFVNHWKSKSGGEEATKIWRSWQEAVLANNIIKVEKSKIPFLAAGDFNKNVEQFNLDLNNNKIILKRLFSKSETSLIDSVWLNSDLSPEKSGSYYFRGDWNSIDNIFYGKNIKIYNFSPVVSEPWCTKEGIPIKYTYYNGQGYSDHLPLFCNFSFF